MRRLATLALALLVAGSLAACGDDDTDTSAPADTTSDSPAPLGDDPSAVGDDAGSGGDDTPTGSFGTATVGDTTYSFDQALRCEEDDLGIDGMEREIEAQFLGRSDDGRIQLDLYISEFSGMPMHDVSWAGPEGVFGASFTQIGGTWMGENDDVYQDAPIALDGDRATGSVVLYDGMTMEESIELDFDVVVPSDTFACR
jgi:hypothetical protein